MNSMLLIYGKEGECDIKYEISHEENENTFCSSKHWLWWFDDFYD